jgi:hypothetical protein
MTISQPQSHVQCASCAIFAPVTDMDFRDHFGGFYRCKDRFTCDVRFHLEICRRPEVRAAFPAGPPSCVFCMAGVSHQRFGRRALLQRVPPGAPLRQLPRPR